MIGADGCLVVMADTHLVRRTAHLQTWILGGIWAYRERAGSNFRYELEKHYRELEEPGGWCRCSFVLFWVFSPTLEIFTLD